MNKLDLHKTQFLEDGGKLRLFRRRTGYFLFDKNGPVRRIGWDEWFADRESYRADGLYLRTVWTLEEVPHGK